ncbi:MAG: FkbM family methyltransferase [Rhodobacteraceae bacterium]|nr:FkbM family methyltransferase [Paracoccaceae bacterium]
MNDGILAHIYEGIYERPEINGLARVIRPGDRVLELGCGLGIITALAARAAGSEGRVRAYEANASLLADTLAFFAANKITTVDLVNAALVPEANPAPRRFHLAGSFAESSLMGADGRRPQGMVEVQAECLVDVLTSFRPDVLICDIEGAEAELLSQLPPSTLRAAVVEMHPDRLSAAEIQSIHAAMAAQGLHPQEPGPGGTVVYYAKAEAA